MNNNDIKYTHIDKFWRRYVIALFSIAFLSAVFTAVFFKTPVLKPGVEIDQALVSTETEFAESPQIYTNSLSDGWENWSWGARVNFLSYAFSKERGGAIKIQYEKPDAGFMIRTPHFDVSPYRTLEFSIYNAGVQNRNDIFIELTGQDDALIGRQLVSWYSADKVLKPNRWYHLSIPLANLGAGGARIGTIALVSGSLGTIYLDDLEFSETVVSSPAWREGLENNEQAATAAESSAAYEGFPYPYDSNFFLNKDDWQATGGLIHIAGGKARFETASTTNYSIFVLKGGKYWINYEYTVFLDWAGGDSINLISRYSPESDSYFSCSFFDDGFNVTLYQFQNGKLISLNAAPNYLPQRKYSWTDARSLGIRTEGDEISCLTNGSVKVKGKALLPMPVSGNAALEMWNPQNGEGSIIINKVTVEGL